jgi:hypothetical protein
MHAYQEYSPDDYSVVFNAIPIEGFAEGDVIDVEYDTEGFSDEIGVDGHVIRYKSCDQRATVTFTLMATSYNADLKSPNGIGVGPLLIRDTQGVTVFAGAQAWIQKMPKVTIGQKLANREWVIRVAKLEAVVG